MKVRPLAFDSLGTRSMSTLIETQEATILIDPGAALGPKRFGLPPHPVEYQKLREHKELISREASEADLIIVTHYHYDHVPRPSEDVGWLRKAKLLIKDPNHMINYSQRNRSRLFLQQLQRVEAKVEVADGREIKLGGCRIKFSKPVQHGNDSRLGYVLEVMVEENGERVLHTSDVEGLVNDAQLGFILSNPPQTLICDGPMTYMLGANFTEKDLDISIRNLSKIIAETGVETVILDHHLTRDGMWRERLGRLFEFAGEFNARVQTAASFLGVREEMLESMRKKLYREYPPE